MIPRTLVLFGYLFLVTLVSLVVCNDPLKFYCPDDAVYNTNTTNGRTYRENLNSLLSVLISNASQPNGFYNYTAGGSGESALYGLFLCRGDIKASDCRDCLTTATSDILRLCPNKNRATAWYEYCMFRYSTESIFSQLDANIGGFLANPLNASDLVSFNQVLADTFNQIATRAAAYGGDPGYSGKKFAVQDANFTSSRRLYALGQCTPDLSSFDCESCLRNTISQLPSCCINRRSAIVFEASCVIRYDLYKFYNQVPSPLPPAPPVHSLPPPPPSGPATAGNKDTGGVSTTIIVLIAVPIVASMVAFVVVFWRVKKAKKSQNIIHETSGVSRISMDAESLHYNFTQIQAYTNNFSIENQIGEGGFGPVYKGTLPNGQKIAVKRLSCSSKQGTKEFISEIAFVAKLHHRNMVRLLGYCLEGEEKLLIYEYIHNRSLDYFLFDLEKQFLLNWMARYNIIGGIARGLLYLHEESRIKIIHRDLKASNVLLDKNMNPKIADFGLARLFEIDQSNERTTRIAGTLGYMSPEYALHGLFSVKSDVFSFGVLVLEIISGKKNCNFLQSHGGDRDDLLRYSWRQWRNGTPLAILDPSIGESYARQEVIQCIHIGLLCVQKDVEHRPTMASVVLMLNSYSVTLPTPNPPPFFDHSTQPPLFPSELPADARANHSSLPKSSINEVSITELHPR